MAHSLSHIIPRVGPHMAHINWFGKGKSSYHCLCRGTVDHSCSMGPPWTVRGADKLRQVGI